MPRARNPLSIKTRTAMVASLHKAHGLVERQEYQAAKDLLTSVSRDAAFAGVESADLLWGLAIVSDYLGELDDAFVYITKAIRRDPLSPSIENSFGIICSRIRAALSDVNRDPADATTPKYFRMLVQAGKCDETSHLAMARHLDHGGKPEEALRILEALNVIAPTFREGWELKAKVLGKLGRSGAMEAEAEAEFCASGPEPLFLPASMAQA
jgi:tetratricopeptide (TPR) repeat protein